MRKSVSDQDAFGAPGPDLAVLWPTGGPKAVAPLIATSDVHLR